MELVMVDGHAKLEDGKPVYRHGDGSEVAIDVPGMSVTNGRLVTEVKGYREAAQAAQAQLKQFADAGITDPDAAAAALKTVDGLDKKKLIDAGEVERVKEEIGKVYQEKLKAAEEKAATFEGQLIKEKIGGSFARSKFRAEKMIEAFDATTTEAIFGQRFKIEDGEVRGYDQHGNKLLSKSRPGEFADFDEALELLTEAHPNKLNILKHSGATGGGATGGNAGSATNRLNDIKDPVARMTAARAAGVTK